VGFLVKTMLSFQGQYELFQSLASDADSTNLTLGKKLINIGNHKVEGTLGIYLTDEVYSFTTKTDAITGTSYQSYRLPVGFKSLTDLYVTSGTTRYGGDSSTILIQDEGLWQQLNASTTNPTNNNLQFVFIRRDRVELYPIPSSACTATMHYRSIGKDLTASDYITGTITTLANGASTVTGNGSTWTAAMVGRYFQTDDEEWYRIATFLTATTLTLEEKYQGASIAAGTSAYTIGEMPRIPGDFHDLPVWYALWKYYQFKKDRLMSREYKNDWLSGLADAKTEYANKGTSQIVSTSPGGVRRGVFNPNMYPENMS